MNRPGRTASQNLTPGGGAYVGIKDEERAWYRGGGKFQTEISTSQRRGG